MASQSETGHAKNVATFNTIISFCQGYGSQYQPTLAPLEMANLQSLLQAAQNALDDCKKKQLNFNNEVDKRMQTFQALKPLAQKIIAALSVSGATTLSIEGAKTIYRKIQGRRAGKIQATENAIPDTPKNISVSQLSYDNLMANFSALIALLESLPEYKPNETELQLSSLTTYLIQLKTANNALTEAYTAWSNSRISRDETLYGKNGGMVDTALQVKNYVKSVFGSSSPQYQQISALQLVRIEH
jgi:hypothetical protein